MSYIDSIGWALVNDKKVIILFPEAEIKHYDNFRKDSHIKLPLCGGIVWRVVHKILCCNPLMRKFYEMELSKKFGFYAGWDLSSSMQYYPKVKEEIVRIFTPNKDITEPIDRLFSCERQQGTTIIGVHFRKGDYKDYLGGKYYFDDVVFKHYMNQMKSILPNSVFFIASNEMVSSSFYEEYSVLSSPVTNAPGDMYALQRCDYIMGPPSTFSGWASLMGNVPLYYIKERNRTITLADFKPMRG